MRKKSGFFTIVLVFMATAVGLSQPDFSGTWKIDPGKSSFGCPCRSDAFFIPIDSIQSIRQAEATIMVSLLLQGKSEVISAELTFLTDGSQSTNQLEDCLLVSEARLVGRNLLFHNYLETDPGTPSWKETWTLSEGGEMLTIKRDMCPTSGWDCQSLVFTRIE